MFQQSTPAIDLVPESIQAAALCVRELASYRVKMTVEDLQEFPHAQMLLGFVRGVAAGLGLELSQLLTLVEAAEPDLGPCDAVWHCLS